jgi:hypothetical protein
MASETVAFSRSALLDTSGVMAVKSSIYIHQLSQYHCEVKRYI